MTRVIEQPRVLWNTRRNSDWALSGTGCTPPDIGYECCGAMGLQTRHPFYPEFPSRVNTSSRVRNPHPADPGCQEQLSIPAAPRRTAGIGKTPQSSRGQSPERSFPLGLDLHGTGDKNRSSHGWMHCGPPTAAERTEIALLKSLVYDLIEDEYKEILLASQRQVFQPVFTSNNTSIYCYCIHILILGSASV